MDDTINWHEVAEVEWKIVSCNTCRASSESDPGSPQASWIGPRYELGGVAFVLQNPGVTPVSWQTDRREQRLAELLDRFRIEHDKASYQRLVSEMHLQMQGLGDTGPQPWGRWVHPVSKCVDGCLVPAQFAWMNVVKHRTPDRSGKAKDRSTVPAENAHGLTHLREELRVLRPSIVVAVGAPARDALDQVPGDWVVLTVGQRARIEDARHVRDRIRATGACRG